VSNNIPIDKNQLKLELKKMIILECQKELVPEQIADDAILIGSEGKFDLDSLDALQISLAVQQKYGKRIEGSNETRFALTSINTLADYILS
jgi:acyl carrier protein